MMTDRGRTIRVTLNGRAAIASIAVYETVIEVLQREFNLFGGRESCGQGLCGCCTVLVNGMAVSGCLYLAAFVDGAEVVTVEGLADRGVLHPIQQAFVSKTGFQCGYCTPGLIVAAKALLTENPHPTREEFLVGMEGNICRCTGYNKILRACEQAADELGLRKK